MKKTLTLITTLPILALSACGTSTSSTCRDAQRSYAALSAVSFEKPSVKKELLDDIAELAPKGCQYARLSPIVGPSVQRSLGGTYSTVKKTPKKVSKPKAKPISKIKAKVTKIKTKAKSR